MNKRTVKTVGISLLLLLIGLVVLKYYFSTELLKKRSRITIGHIYDYKVLIRSGYDLYFIYNVKGKNYKGDYIVYKNPKVFIDKRYFVEFSPSNPKNCKILLDKLVSDTMMEAPPEGWEKFPQ